MPTLSTKSILIVAILAGSACTPTIVDTSGSDPTTGGGSSTGGGGSTPTTIGLNWYDFNDVSAEVYGLGITDPANIPDSGNATFDGLFNLSNRSTSQSYLGTLAAVVNFGTGDISGTVDEFLTGALTDTTLDPIAGSFAFSGSLTGAGNSLTTDAIGGTWTGGLQGNIESGPLGGYFTGSGAEGVIVQFEPTGGLINPTGEWQGYGPAASQ